MDPHLGDKDGERSTILGHYDEESWMENER